jgi:ParB/RepB/Spo0J family partition protein
MVEVARCDVLKRNPQHLTPKTMARLKESIRRDGFVAPILVRPVGDRYEVVSGNHRFMALRESGAVEVAAVVKSMDDETAQRLALNLNLIHGDPTAEQLAPFLAELSDEVLSQIHLTDALLDDVKTFDAELSERLAELEAPASIATPAKGSETQSTVRCPECGHSFRPSRQTTTE